MTKDELTAWALKNGWQDMAGALVLTKPSNPKEAIVRLSCKATVVVLEFKKPIGKWEKISSTPYSKIEVPHPEEPQSGVSKGEETGFPRGLGLDTISGFSMLMEDNKNRAVFAKLTGRG